MCLTAHYAVQKQIECLDKVPMHAGAVDKNCTASRQRGLERRSSKVPLGDSSIWKSNERVGGILTFTWSGQVLRNHLSVGVSFEDLASVVVFEGFLYHLGIGGGDRIPRTGSMSFQE